MLGYVLRRLVVSIVVLLLATILLFILVAESGNPLAILMANPKIPHAVIVARENLLHLNEPLWQRYWIWFSHAIRGDFGTTVAGQAVEPQLVSHLLVTLRMVILATLVSIVIAIAVGVYAALHQGRVADHAATVTNFLFLAAPTFVIGLLLKEFVAIPINEHLNRTIFYTSGEQSPTLTGSFIQRFPDYAAHTVLPTITLILVTYSSWAIYQRASILDTLTATT